MLMDTLSNEKDQVHERWEQVNDIIEPSHRYRHHRAVNSGTLSTQRDNIREQKVQNRRRDDERGDNLQDENHVRSRLRTLYERRKTYKVNGSTKSMEVHGGL